MRYELQSMKPATTPGKYIMTVKAIPNILARFCGAQEKFEKYFGECTVWYKIPDQVRVGLSLECVLANFWEQIKAEEHKQR